MATIPNPAFDALDAFLLDAFREMSERWHQRDRDVSPPAYDLAELFGGAS